MTTEEKDNMTSRHRKVYGDRANKLRHICGYDLKGLVLSIATEEKLKASYAEDEYFNNIPLAAWDAAGFNIKGGAISFVGGFPSMATRVCILKEVARQIATGEYIN